jgi:hypothetical protein
MPPALVLGTNKLQSSFGPSPPPGFMPARGSLSGPSSGGGHLHLHRGGHRHLAVQTIDAAILERLPFLLMAFACYFYFSPRVSDAESQRRLTPMAFALLGGGFL